MRRATLAIATLIDAGAKENIVDMDAVDTGALLNSDYIETKDASGFEAARSAAQAAADSPGQHSGKPQRKFDVWDEADEGELGPLDARLAFAAGYARAVHDRDENARPYLDQATIAAEDQAGRILLEIVADLADP